MHQQLTEADRAVLAQLLELNYSKVVIAERLCVHRSTIFRELKRNTGPRGYDADELPANEKAHDKLPSCCRKTAAAH